MAKTTFAGLMQIPSVWLNKVFNHRHSGLDEDGSAPIDYAVDTGTANTYAIALTPALLANISGMPVRFKALNANTGASTLNVNGLGAVAIKKNSTEALTAEDIKAGQVVEVAFDGTVFQLLSPPATGQPASSVPWGGVSGKPATFPPEAHLHAGGDIFSAVANATAAPWAGVTGKPATYPPEAHTHDYAPSSQGVSTGNAHDHAGGDGGLIPPSTGLNLSPSLTGNTIANGSSVTWTPTLGAYQAVVTIGTVYFEMYIDATWKRHASIADGFFFCDGTNMRFYFTTVNDRIDFQKF